MELKTIVIGSGLSSAFFCEAYLKNNSEIDIISNDFVSIKQNQNLSNNQRKNLPIQINENDMDNICDYLSKNKIILKNNVNIFGSLNKWGNSNYWGYGLDRLKDEDLNSFDITQKNRIKKIYEYIYTKNNYIGNPDDKVVNEINPNHLLSNFLKKNEINNLNITKTFLGINKNFLNYSFKKKNWNDIRKSNDTLNPETYFKYLSKSNKINFHNLFVNNIYFIEGKYILECLDENNNNISIRAKKIILCCGTISTTRLVTNLIRYKNEVKILHHPMNFSLYISKNKIVENNFIPALINIKSSINNINYNSNIRLTSDEIENKISEIYKILFLFNFQKKILKKISKYFLFCNNYLDTKYSNLYFKNNLKNIEIYSKKNVGTLNYLNNVSKDIKVNLIKKNLISPIHKNFFPGFGADYHYMGTIPISDKEEDLTVNTNCELKKFSNFFIADGSVIDFKSNTFPMGLIISNAYRIGEIVSKL